MASHTHSMFDDPGCEERLRTQTPWTSGIAAIDILCRSLMLPSIRTSTNDSRHKHGENPERSNCEMPTGRHQLKVHALPVTLGSRLQRLPRLVLAYSRLASNMETLAQSEHTRGLDSPPAMNPLLDRSWKGTQKRVLSWVEICIPRIRIVGFKGHLLSTYTPLGPFALVQHPRSDHSHHVEL